MFEFQTFVLTTLHEKQEKFSASLQAGRPQLGRPAPHVISGRPLPRRYCNTLIFKLGA
jgi:hypothetical protein